MNKVASKQEVLRGLSKQIRRPNLEDKMFVKLLRMYGELQGWFDNKTATPSPTKVQR